LQSCTSNAFFCCRYIWRQAWHHWVDGMIAWLALTSTLHRSKLLSWLQQSALQCTPKKDLVRTCYLGHPILLVLTRQLHLLQQKDISRARLGRWLQHSLSKMKLH
jgi:hypothetical protein